MRIMSYEMKLTQGDEQMKIAADFEKEFYASVEKAPEGIRSTVEAMAWENSFAVETYKEYDNDIERWEVAIRLVAEILDAPADYGL